MLQETFCSQSSLTGRQRGSQETSRYYFFHIPMLLFSHYIVFQVVLIISSSLQITTQRATAWIARNMRGHCCGNIRTMKGRRNQTVPKKKHIHIFARALRSGKSFFIIPISNPGYIEYKKLYPDNFQTMNCCYTHPPTTSDSKTIFGSDGYRVRIMNILEIKSRS